MNFLLLSLFILENVFNYSTNTSLVEIPITQKTQVYEISKLKLDVCDVTENYIRVISNPGGLQLLGNAGYRYKILLEDYTERTKELIKQGDYHTYDEIIQAMDSIVINYPGISVIDTIGYSAGGRLILGMKISDNPGTEEEEPCIRITGCHHGDEIISSEIVFRLIEYLVSNYSTDSIVKELVDTRQIWLIPDVNPDGMCNISRYNENGIDLNRDYGYMWGGWGASPAPFSQPETRALQLNAEKHRFTLSFDYHSVATYVNCLWDYTSLRPDIDSIMLNIGKEYVDSTGYTMIHGYDWYQVCGSCQDAISGIEGTIGYTIETPQPADPTPVCDLNIKAALQMIKRTGDRGIAGKVTDFSTGTPLDARLGIEGVDWNVYANSNTGFYHIALLPGTYNLKVFANGYTGKTISNVTVNNSVVTTDVLLTPSVSDTYYAYKIVWVKCSANSNQTMTPAAIGPQDNKFFSIGTGGTIVLDMGIPIVDSFTIYEGTDTIPDEGYQVLISSDWQDTFVTLGNGSGTATFNISSSGLSDVRYIKLIDDGDDSNQEYPGFDLDAIQAYGVFGVSEKYPLISNVTLSSNPVINELAVKINGKDGENSILKLYNITGRLVMKKSVVNNIPIKIPVDKLPGNVYFLKFFSADERSCGITKKVIILPALH